ncbi:IMP dehydrogenase [Streptomyces varsoviensis]|uniref:IMP dehydrogenase n=1 Tax=Streptomyces varsoviensis TaxID=67373 RepID=UPI0033EF8638
MTGGHKARAQAVSTPELAVALAGSGGLGFLHHNRPVEDQVAAVRQAKADQAGQAGPKPSANRLVDGAGRPRVGAGVNTHDYRERVPALLEAGADALCFDSSDGYSDWQAEALSGVKERYPRTPVGGMDGYVPHAGDLDEGLARTVAKLKTTMVSCGSTTLPEFRATARLTLVSDQSFQESHTNVTLREAPATLS